MNTTTDPANLYYYGPFIRERYTEVYLTDFETERIEAWGEFLRESFLSGAVEVGESNPCTYEEFCAKGEQPLTFDEWAETECDAAYNRAMYLAGCEM